MWRRAISIHAAALSALVSAGCDSSVTSAQPSPPPAQGAQTLTTQSQASIPVTLRPQETYMWCWAASGEMVMDFLGTDVSQCDEANEYFGRGDCCNTSLPAACVNGGWPPFGDYGFDFQTTSDAPLGWDTIKEQIGIKRKPFAFSWHALGTGGHMMTAIGYGTADGVNYVAVDDPYPVGMGDYKQITYDAYVSGQDYTHWDDYYDVTKK